MTDNEIIKALECCKKDDCDNCPNDFGNCYANLSGYALDLINRQKAEIERLTAERNAMHQYVKAAEEYAWQCKTAKSEAIKEFAKILDFDHCIDVIYDGSGELNRVAIRRVLFNKQIDNLVKEMTESEVKINDK